MCHFDENSYDQFKEGLRKSRVISMPKNNISTFGNTVYNYYFIGKLTGNQSQVQEGHIKVQCPLFLAPFTDREIFKGFPSNNEEMVKKLLGDIHPNNTFLIEYQFEHIPRHSWTEKTPYPILLGEMKSNYGNNLFDVLVAGDVQFWSMALIKFCLKIVQKSIPINFTELEERGLLDENRIPPQTKKKVNDFFSQAEKDPKFIRPLGDFLVSNKIFDLYEEKFFDLIDKGKRNV